MKTMRNFLAVLFSIVAMFSSTLTANASNDGIDLCIDYVSSIKTSFTISSSGKATVTNSYVGISGVTKSVKIVTKVQKKVGIIWVTVSDGSWTDTSTSLSYTKSHSVQLSSSDTYRAHVVFTVTSVDGDTDKETKNVEKDY